jgi:tetratricopeptide (TPR) repeat protein
LDQVDDDAAHGCYQMQRAIVFKRLGGAENLDRALMENTAARVYLEQANHMRYVAGVENNIGIIFRELGRYDEALDRLERARLTFIELGDVGTAAQVNDTRARVFIEQKRYVEAEKLAFLSASALEAGDEQSLLADALETQGTALARMGRHKSALIVLQRAARIAETAGDVPLSGRIFLTILEEVKNLLSPPEIRNIYREADDRVGEPLSMEVMSRLRACARLIASNAGTSVTEHPASLLVSLKRQVHQCESELIKIALDQANGSVTRAARQLGLTHQGLCYIINHRHKQLLVARAPIRVRRKSIIKKRGNRVRS